MNKQEIADGLKQGLARLGPNGENWMKGNYSDGTKMCASQSVGRQFDPVYFALQSAIPNPERYEGTPLVSEWNDAPETTFEDVRGVFLKAIQTQES